MKLSNRFAAPGALLLAAVTMGLSGCVIHEHDTAPSASYAQGYKEGYYDRQHNRYWHDQAWHDCVQHDTHCG